MALDLLQLDFRSEATVVQPNALLEVLPAIHKYFYLDEQLGLVTDAGSGNVFEMTEALARYLREHDDPRVPISAIRGANLTSRLSGYITDGLELRDLHTDEDLANLVPRIRSAQVELGAGPIATALADGSRMVVAGSYDVTAPFVAAAVVGHELDWNNAEFLASVAVSSMLSGETASTVEISDKLAVCLVNSSRTLSAADPGELLAPIRAQGETPCADVVCNLSELRLVPDEFQSTRIEGVAGTHPTGNWRVRLVVRDELGAESLRWSSIPREMVNVSVDTRYAAEWI